MKLTKSQLKQLIKEELHNVLNQHRTLKETRTAAGAAAQYLNQIEAVYNNLMRKSSFANREQFYKKFIQQATEFPWKEGHGPSEEAKKYAKDYAHIAYSVALHALRQEGGYDIGRLLHQWQKVKGK